MKKLIISLLLTLVMLSCNNVNLGSPQFPPDLCAEFNEYKDQSLLLNVQKQYNIPLNEIYYGLIDSTKIAVITDVVEKEWISSYLNKVGTFYAERYPNLTHNELITYMVSQEVWNEKIELITSILSSRIGYFKSNTPVNPFDNCMYEKGWVNAKKLLFIK